MLRPPESRRAQNHSKGARFADGPEISANAGDKTKNPTFARAGRTWGTHD
jgi:hypothetical protein